MKLATHESSNLAYIPGCRRALLHAVRNYAAAILLLAALLVLFPGKVKFYCYTAVRELAKYHAMLGTLGLEKLTSEHYYIKFKPEDRALAALVLSTAESFYLPVTGQFDFTLRGRIPIILHSSRADLNRYFGWEANESAIGVYWAGVIRVLSPAAWVNAKEPEQFAEIFAADGPMAHELTHLVVDYLTGGNYPRWFTEGVAQYEEYKLTGYEITGGNYAELPNYSYSELAGDFDSLANQTAAYRGSLDAVRFIVSRGGEAAIAQIMVELKHGMDFNRALTRVLGMDEVQFEASWQAWQRAQSAI
ncbi:MAG: peptidase MA family metallohydrolase [Pelotomaculum sp.]|jgi:hypothetical protein